MDNNGFNKFLGTWIGSVIQKDSNGEVKRTTQICWRIHCYNTLKNEIELTELGHNFQNSLEIPNPKRTIYSGHIDGDSLYIEFDQQTADDKIFIKLNFARQQEMELMNGGSEPLKGTGEIRSFYLGKVSNDTSTFIKPEGGPVVVKVFKQPLDIKTITPDLKL